MSVRRIWFLPMDSYEGRYTAQWRRWWTAALNETCKARGVEAVIVDGTQVTTTIRTGSVLDGIGTCYWKCTQLAQVIDNFERGYIQDGDVFFVADAWFPGIEMLDYIRRITDRRFLQCGLLHAGSYLTGDYTHTYGIDRWAQHSEHGWLLSLDIIFVATDYHRRELLAAHPDLDRRVLVEGFPLWPEDVWDEQSSLNKENIIVFPHGKDQTKGYAQYTAFRERMQSKLPDWKWVVSQEITKTKAEYYNLLRRSKIALSFAEQETFGYSMLEAAAAGCHILAPNRLSYPEIFPRDALWSTEEELAAKLIDAATGRLRNDRAVAARYRFAANRILERTLQLSDSL